VKLLSGLCATTLVELFICCITLVDVHAGLAFGFSSSKVNWLLLKRVLLD
jgi:hypothetical protein